MHISSDMVNSIIRGGGAYSIHLSKQSISKETNCTEHQYTYEYVPPPFPIIKFAMQYATAY